MLYPIELQAPAHKMADRSREGQPSHPPPPSTGRGVNIGPLTYRSSHLYWAVSNSNWGQLMPEVTSYLPLNPRDYLVLFSLSEGERHGYGIVKEVEEQSDGAVKMDPSNLYRTLKRLIQQGLVQESDPRTVEADDERRRYYSITTLGRKVVRAEAARLSKLTTAAAQRRLITR
jgi:DNA-binding PadR family transcriptional regulator